MAWSYRDKPLHTGMRCFWGRSIFESLGMSASDMTNLINEGSSEKSLADIKRFLQRMVAKVQLLATQMIVKQSPVVEAVRETAFIQPS